MATETELTGQFEQLKREHAVLIRAVQLLLALFILVFATLCVRSALSIPEMKGMFRDMLPGEGLPTSSRIVSSHPTAFLASGIILGVAGLGLLFTGKAPVKRFIAA